MSMASSLTCKGVQGPPTKPRLINIKFCAIPNWCHAKRKATTDHLATRYSSTAALSKAVLAVASCVRQRHRNLFHGSKRQAGQEYREHCELASAPLCDDDWSDFYHDLDRIAFLLQHPDMYGQEPTTPYKCLVKPVCNMPRAVLDTLPAPFQLEYSRRGMIKASPAKAQREPTCSCSQDSLTASIFDNVSIKRENKPLGTAEQICDEESSGFEAARSTHAAQLATPDHPLVAPRFTSTIALDLKLLPSTGADHIIPMSSTTYFDPIFDNLEWQGGKGPAKALGPTSLPSMSRACHHLHELLPQTLSVPCMVQELHGLNRTPLLPHTSLLDQDAFSVGAAPVPCVPAASPQWEGLLDLSLQPSDEAQLAAMPSCNCAKGLLLGGSSILQYPNPAQFSLQPSCSADFDDLIDDS